MRSLKGLVIGDSPYPDISHVVRYEDGTSIAFAVSNRCKSLPSSYRNLNKLYEKTFGQSIPDCTFSNWLQDGYLFLNWSDNRDYIELLWQAPDLPVWCMCAKAAKHRPLNNRFIHTPHPSGANPTFHKWLNRMDASQSPFRFMDLYHV